MSGTGGRSRAGSSASRAKRRGPAVLSVILGVLLAPLGVGSILAAERIGRLQDRRQNLEVLADSGSRLTSLSTIRVATMEERLLDGALLALRLYEVDPRLASLAAGFDFEAEAAATTDQVDRLLAGLRPELAQAIDRERGRQYEVDDLLAFNSGYLTIESAVVDEQLGQQVLLDRALSALEDSDELRGRLTTLEAAIESHHRVSELSAAYLGLLLLTTSLPPEQQVRHLHEHRFSYDQARARLAGDNRALLESDPATATLVTMVDDALAVAALDGVSALTIDVDQGAIESLVPIRSVFADTKASTEVHRQVVDSAAERLASSIAAADAEARGQIRTSVIVLGLLGLATLVGVWLAASLIVAPLRRLVAGIGHLQEGGVDRPLELTGVREVRAAAEAINQAAASLAAAEQRSRELAATVLANDIGDAEAIGQILPSVEGGSTLGAALHTSLEQLNVVMQEREELRARLHHEASHDPMTGLLNRRGFRIELESRWAAEGDVPPTVLYLDLDRFKLVNDTHGHSVGDELLVAVADRLREVTGDEIIARMGGDEFVVVGFGPDPTFGFRVGAEIKRALQTPFPTTVGPIGIDASVGYASAGGAQGLGSVLQQADTAAYYAKLHRHPAPVGFDEEVARWMRDRPARIAG